MKIHTIDNHDIILHIIRFIFIDFFFKKSILSWNTILYLNFKKDQKKSLTRKFNFSLLAESKKNKISLVLNKIISNNK